MAISNPWDSASINASIDRRANIALINTTSSRRREGSLFNPAPFAIFRKTETPYTGALRKNESKNFHRPSMAVKWRWDAITGPIRARHQIEFPPNLRTDIFIQVIITKQSDAVVHIWAENQKKRRREIPKGKMKPKTATIVKPRLSGHTVFTRQQQQKMHSFMRQIEARSTKVGVHWNLAEALRLKLKVRNT